MKRALVIAIVSIVTTLLLTPIFIVIAQGTSSSGWSQINSDGFGDAENEVIYALAPFGGQLYASTGLLDASATDAQLWRWENGLWSTITTNGFGDSNNKGIDHLIEFNGQFYAGTWNDNGGQVWRSANGQNWNQVASGGFGDSTNAEVFRFGIFSNTLYASTWSYTSTHGAEIWRTTTGNNGDWNQTGFDGFGDSNNEGIPAFAVYDGYFYAGTANLTTGGEVWRSLDGISWNQINSDGFGDADNLSITALVNFNGYLYAGTWHSQGAGTQIWRCQLCDNTDWTPVVNNGFGNVDTRPGPAFDIFDGYLYTVIGNWSTGLEVWRSSDGVNWEQVGFDGFGDGNNTYSYWDNAVALHNDNLYIGTFNDDTGGEVWLYLSNKVYLPVIVKE